jgi:flagellar motor switch protein FliM
VSLETLSQSEIDQLLGGAAPAAEPVEHQLQIYDFRRPHRVSRDKLRSIEALYGRLAKSLEGWLMGRVRGQVELSLQSVEQLSFGEFTLSLSTPCCSYLFGISDSGGQQAVVDFGSEFAFYLVDRLFGGSGRPVVPDRALTPMERMAVRVVAERVSGLVCEVWNDYTEFSLLLDGWESIPEILQAANREDPVLVATFEVAAGRLRSLFSICLPLSVLEKYFVGSGTRRESSVIGSEREREENRERTETSVRAARVQVAARLPAFRLSMREIAGLRVGTVLSTGIAATSGVEVLINGQRRFRGAPGRIRRSLATRIVEQIALPGAAPAAAPAPLADPNALD